MEGADPDAPTLKRPRLDSVNPPPPPPHNGLVPPPHPNQAQAARHPSQPSSPPSRHHHPAHGLPHPPGPYPPQAPPSGQGHHYQPQGHQPHPPHQPHQPHPPHPSSSVPPSDIRAYSDPTTLRPVLSSPHQRASYGFPVTLPALPTAVDQDRISDYARPPLPAPSTAPEPQSSRSTSIDAKAQPGMEHAGHPAPWPGNPDHRPNGNYPNGNYQRVVSPSNPHEQQFQTPHLPPGQQYAQPVNAFPPGPYMGGSAAQFPGQRRKQVRAAQACNHCRSRKQKCDEARPCQFCRDNNLSHDCQYKDIPPPKQDRSMMQLQESVNSMSETLKSFVESFNVWKNTVESRLPPFKAGESMGIASHQLSPEQNYLTKNSMSDQSGSRMPTPVQGRGHFRRVNSMKMESPVVQYSNISPLPAHASTPVAQESVVAAPQPPATPADSVRTDHTNPTRDNKTKTGLQGDHTTPAHQVLEDWPSMANFCDGIKEIASLKERHKSISDYPMELEQDRGIVRVWGVGQGIDRYDGAQGPGSPESQNSDTPSPPAEKEPVWGKMEASSPSTLGADTPQYEEDLGGLGPDGRLKLDNETLWRLHDSYYHNVHSLHPFLNPSALRRMVKEFGDLYGPESKRGQVHAGYKRKRSGSAFVESHSPAMDKASVESIERSLRNAIVLLVLALGKVCEYKDPLPSPYADRAPTESAPWGPTRASPRSANNSFSSDYGTASRPRNIDILPGMAYFSYATDILGNQQGGNTTGHAQAMILAGLYMGQFARVLESWSWISNACRACLVLIKAEMPYISRIAFFAKTEQKLSDKENFRLNLIKCVYWTCLQLETDILAEMSTLPPSDVSKYQEEISYPSGVFEKFPDVASYNENSEHDKTMWIYSSQIHLRVILNEAHNTLYSSGRKRSAGLNAQNLDEVANAARVHADILMTWRKLLPNELSWDDGDPPATDINIARLRAKFYGGHYMILRPFLYLAVHDIELPPRPPTAGWSSQTSSPAAIAEAAASTPNSQTQSRGMVELNSNQNGVLEVAHMCISAAIQSTIAFDRVGAHPDTVYQEFKDTPKERFIVTNIFGTLHAQFGNMIVLGAVYNSRLRRYLPPDTKLTRRNLSLLYRRTIKMLRQVGPNSPVLTVDADVLENVRNQIQLDP